MKRNSQYKMNSFKYLTSMAILLLAENAVSAQVRKDTVKKQTVNMTST